MTPAPREFAMPVRVYIEDTDAGGIVYYVNYLKFMERARTEWLRVLGFQHYTLLEDDFLFVVRHAEVDYRRSACIDDELRVTAAVERLGGATLHFRQRVLRAADGEVLAEGRVEVGCVSRSARAPRRMPKEIHDAVRRWLDGSAAATGND